MPKNLKGADISTTLRRNQMAGIGCITLALLFVGQGAVLRQLSRWGLTSQAMQFTELYFSDPRQLPHTIIVKPDTSQTLRFTVSNHEGQRTVYRYKLEALAGAGTTSMSEGSVNIGDNTTQTIDLRFSPPALDSRVRFRVALTFDEQKPGSTKSQAMTQEIGYWARVQEWKRPA